MPKNRMAFPTRPPSDVSAEDPRSPGRTTFSLGFRCTPDDRVPPARGASAKETAALVSARTSAAGTPPDCAGDEADRALKLLVTGVGMTCVALFTVPFIFSLGGENDAPTSPRDEAVLTGGAGGGAWGAPSRLLPRATFESPLPAASTGADDGTDAEG